MDTGLLIVRVVVGLLLAGHGAQKLFGLFGGYGLQGTGGFMESLGYRPGRPMAFLAGVGEFLGGVLLALGLFTPFAAAAAIAVMVNAIVSAHWGKGPWATNGGWELPLINAVAAAAIAFTGPGRFSVDRALDWPLRGTEWGLVAVALGLTGAGVVLAMRAATSRRQTAPETAVAGGREMARQRQYQS